MKNKIAVVLFLLSAVALFSCAPKSSYAPKPPVFKDMYKEVKTKTAKKEKEESIVLEKEEKLKKAKVEIISLPNPIKKARINFKIEAKKGKIKEKAIELPTQGDVQISVEDIPVYDFINLVFGKILGVNYILSPEVQKIDKKITINMVEPMKPKEFLYFVIDLLKKYDIEVSYEKGIFNIKKAKRIVQTIYSSKIFIGRDLSKIPDEEIITSIIPTYYIPARSLMGTLTQFMTASMNLLMTSSSYANALIFSGRAENIKKILKIVNILDRPYFEDKKVYLAKLEYITAGEFKQSIENILRSLGIPIANDIKSVGILIVPIEKMNAVMIISPREEWVKTIKYWQEKLDTVESLGEEVRLFTYKTKNRSAKEVSNILKNLLGSVVKSAKVKEKVATPQKGTRARRGVVKKPVTKKKKTYGAFQNFNVVVDEERNTLIISAYPSDWKKIKKLLERIDTPPKQILVEVTIAELTLSDELKYGLEWYLKHTSKDYLGSINFLSGSGGAGAAGFLYTLTGTGGKFQAILSAFASKNLVNIISTPHVVVLDGKSASINVGTQVPVVTSESTSADLGGGNRPSILRNIQYRSTGVNLSITPTVTSEGKLRIKINQSLSEVQGYAPGLNSPVILNRSINTEVVVKSGETVLLGGLISETEGGGVNKVPLLADIPVFGNLFKVKSKEHKKTELIVEITPYILNKSDELDELTRKFLQTTNIFQKYDRNVDLFKSLQ